LTAAYGTKWNGNASATNGSLFAAQSMAVRRLTPIECERLQGFPDNYTSIPWRKKEANECPDGPRYKALGNSWAVPNVRWIGRRIKLALEIAK
jgi:DNA (cytosine-5)-methyltransferase 1